MAESITINNLDEATAGWIDMDAKKRGTNKEAVALHLIRKGIECEHGHIALQTYDDLDALAGTWSEEQAAEFAQAHDDSMRDEYDFTGGIRGKHHRALQAGYTITIHQPDGKEIVKEVKPQEGAVVLAPDVREYFPDSESVNDALRSLIKLIPRKRRPSTKRARATDTKK